MPRTDLEVLNQVRIASPCEVGWDTMKGDDRVRHCAQCDRSVYNLAKLTAAEAVALLRAEGGPPCLQIWRRADGTVLTADCPVGRRVVARRRSCLALAAAVALGLLGAGVWATHRPLPPPTELPTTVMGEMVAPSDLQRGRVGNPTRLMGKMLPSRPKPRTPRPKPLPATMLMGDVDLHLDPTPTRGEAVAPPPCPAK